MSSGFDWSGWILWIYSHFWTFSIAVLIFVGLLEHFCEANPLRVPYWRRWPLHVFLLLLIQTSLYPLRAVSGHALAEWASVQQIGVLPLTTLPLILRIIVTFLLLDLTHYAAHYLYHHSAWLWNFHAIHHNDEDMDWSTGFRFHPVEPLITLVIESAMILLLGPPPEAILLFVLTLSMQNYLSHANFLVPAPLARWADRLWLSPNLHRLHHSDQIAHQQSNYGIISSLWDHLFGTFTPATPSALNSVRVGLTETHAHPTNNPLRLLVQPFTTRSLPSSPQDPLPYPQPDSRTS